jgi:hypothetical protein
MEQLMNKCSKEEQLQAVYFFIVNVGGGLNLNPLLSPPAKIYETENCLYTTASYE